jgi:hypothetical protein
MLLTIAKDRLLVAATSAGIPFLRLRSASLGHETRF